MKEDQIIHHFIFVTFFAGESRFIMNNYKIVDTHFHLCDPIFDSDRTEVIERARDAGVSAIFTVGENLSDAMLNIELAEALTDYENVLNLPSRGSR